MLTFSGTGMKEKTRDNLIYLGVAFTIVALLVVDLWYAEVHNQKMWLPSRFSTRATYTSALLGYFVVRESRRLHAAVIRILVCVFLAEIVHLAILFVFRQLVGQLSGLEFAGYAVFEISFVFILVTTGLRYLRPEG